MVAFRIPEFVRELRRRHVFRVAAVYVATAWILLEGATMVVPLLGLPDWTATLVLVLLLLGFPLAIVLAWALELTPEGVRRAEPWQGGGLLPSRQARWLAAGALIVLVLAAGARTLLQRRSEPLLPASPLRLAVLPFSVRGSEALAYLDAGMVDLLSTTLNGVGELRTVDPHAVLSAVRHAGTTDADQDRALAQTLGAGLYVRGSVVAVSGNVQLHGALYDVARGAEPVTEAVVQGPEEDIFRLVDRLAAELVAGRMRTPRARFTRLATLTTSSVPALKAYLEGEGHLRAGRYDTAIDAFQRAIAEDSTFALAHFRLASAAAWLERGLLTRHGLEQAQRYGAHLPEQERLLVEALLASGNGAHAEAERRLRALVEMYPDDVEGWYRLGDLLLHHGDLMGYSLVESGPAFERSHALDPEHAPTLFHASNVAARRGDRAALDSITRDFLRLQPTDESVRFLLAQQALLHRDTAAMERLVRDFSKTDEALYDILFAVWSTQQLAGGYRLAEVLVQPGRLASTARAGHLFRAVLELARGRWAAARAELRSPAVDPVSALEYEALLALGPLTPVADRDLEDLRRRLQSGDTVVANPPGAPDSPLSDPHQGWHQEIRSYLLALISSRLGDAAAAERYATELERRTGPEHAQALPQDFARIVRAAEARRRGAPADALRILETARFWTEDRLDERFSAFSAHAYAKFLRAELLHELARDREALRWYGVAGEWPFELHYLAPAHLRQAEILDRTGDRDRAARHRARFLELWQDCEPELRSLTAAVEQKVKALTVER